MNSTEFISGITPVTGIDGIPASGKTGELREEAGLFRDIFRSVAENAKNAQLEVENKQYLLATGQLSDAHSLPIAEAKAAISLDLMITLRNKALESYQELLKISI